MVNSTIVTQTIIICMLVFIITKMYEIDTKLSQQKTQPFKNFFNPIPRPAPSPMSDVQEKNHAEPDEACIEEDDNDSTCAQEYD